MKARQRPRKSLRTILILWLLIFSIVPLAFITGYSLVKYEQAIDQELSTRLMGNAREISQILNEFQSALVGESNQVAADRALIYFMNSANPAAARDGLRRWLGGKVAQRVWVFNRDARLEIAIHKNEKGEATRDDKLENAGVELNEPMVKALAQKDSMFLVDFTANNFELSLFNKIFNAQGKVVGYVETAMSIDESLLKNIRNRLSAEIFFYQEGKAHIVATHEDLNLYKTETFAPYLKEGDFFEMNIRQVPYRLMLRELKWGDAAFVMGTWCIKVSGSRSAKECQIRILYGRWRDCRASHLFVVDRFTNVAPTDLRRPQRD